MHSLGFDWFNYRSLCFGASFIQENIHLILRSLALGLLGRFRSWLVGDISTLASSFLLLVTHGGRLSYRGDLRWFECLWWFFV